MNILVVNDDGIDAKGIFILASKLKAYGNVIVCAPDRGRSAASHSIALHESLYFTHVKSENGISWYKTSGTPADCVRMPLNLLEESFDIVFSGVNDGLNLGTDIIYSGTVAAAREANIEDIPAVAISTDFDSFSIVEKELDEVLAFIFKNNLYSKEYVLNVNFPTGNHSSSKGYRFCRQGIKNFKTKFISNNDGGYLNSDAAITYDTCKDTDVYLAEAGYVTFVPLQVEQTSYKYLEILKKIS